MHVIFVEPAFPADQREFVHALHGVGAGVSAIGEAPLHALPEDLRAKLLTYEQVSSVVNETELHGAVKRIQARGWVDRLEATVEAHVMAAAKVRQACGIPGTSVETTFLCRDKPAMKEALRKAGVPCARSTGASSAKEVEDFAAEVGYPIIIKPRDAAGAAGTFRVDGPNELPHALAESRVADGAAAAIEEFVDGHEGFYDTISIDGEVVHEFVSHYYPNVLEAMRTRWISPQIVVTNRLNAPGYDDVRAMAAKVIEVLGIGTSATHMEWFFGPKGLKFSEIGCRPPGVSAWGLYSEANDLSVYREWAHALVHGRRERRPSRSHATGHVTLRPDRDGWIVGIEGKDELFESWGEHVFDSHFPAPGSPTQPVEAGFKANAWVRLKHPDYDTLRKMLDRVGELVQVRAQ
ncbi:MAG: ATPase [Acidobacteriota bacterium]